MSKQTEKLANADCEAWYTRRKKADEAAPEVPAHKAEAEA